MLNIALLSLLPFLANANPVNKRWTAEPYAGSTTADVYPPSGSKSYLPLCYSWARHMIRQEAADSQRKPTRPCSLANPKSATLALR